MPPTPPGPDFERSPDQRIIPGDYQDPNPPSIPHTTVTLLDRLRAAIKPSVKRRKGPGFRKPKTWTSWSAKDPEKGGITSARRPSGYEFPSADAKPDAS